MPVSLTLNKYGPDIISDSVLDFIDNNKSNPFFIYYSMILVHNPFCPTPDDAAFAAWDPDNTSDTSFFRSMMHYMDKKIEELVTKLKNLGIENNTVIIFAGDNGTPESVADYIDDSIIVSGGKSSTTEAGTHVPLIVYWPATVEAGGVNNDLIDFTDFLPTLADIANVPTPTSYGSLDGVNFYPRLIDQNGTPRKWIFYHYNAYGHASDLIRWSQTKTYKLYDTSSINQSRLFYNIKNDINEKLPIADDSLTVEEAKIKQQLLDVINKYVAQGPPLISLNSSLSHITDSSVVLKDTIRTNGGSTVTSCGAVWSTSPNPRISSSSHTSTGTIWGPFSTQIKGLMADTIYYIRAYATNFAGTAYSNQVIFKTLLKPPVATKATDIDSNKFTANWKAYTGATNYRLDVSTLPTFTRINTPTMTQGFDNGITPPPAGWAISNNISANTSSFGTTSPSLEFTALNAQVVTEQLSGPAIQLSFWIKGLNTDQESSLLVEGFDGNKWTIIDNLSKLSKTGVIKMFNANFNPPLSQNFIQFRFSYTKKAGTFAFDDVSIKYNKPVPFFIPEYNNLSVNATSKIITGLKAGTNYYYRVRAVTDSAITGNSNVIAVTTKAASIPLTDTVTNNSSIGTANNNDLNVQVLPNPSATEFILILQAIKNGRSEINITDINGKELYRVTGISNNKYIFGKTFPPGVYIVRVVQGKNIQTIK